MTGKEKGDILNLIQVTAWEGLSVPEMDGRPVAKYLIQATKSCSKLGSHWPNKKRLGDCLKDR